MHQREAYLAQLIAHKDQPQVKVITGVRRSGKSTLMAMYRDYLKSVGVRDEQIIALDLEAPEYAELLEHPALYRYIKDRLCANGYTYIFLDEAQNCRGFELAVDGLAARAKTDIYLIGSNAGLLSGELATLLSGRYFTIHMLPLSFREYCADTQTPQRSREERFNAYLHDGAFPYAGMREPSDAAVRPHLEGVYAAILLKDVASREGITDIPLLESIVKCVAKHSASPLSTKKIGDLIAAGGRKISVNTVDHYLRALTDSYIIYRADRYDIKSRQYLKTLGRYYFADTGLRRLLTADSAADWERALENVVYLELMRRGYRVHIGKLADREVDFATSDSHGYRYYQVAVTILSAGALRQELAPLQKIADHYPKMVLTMDSADAGTNYAGIRRMNVLDWLLDSSDSAEAGSIGKEG